MKLKLWHLGAIVGVQAALVAWLLWLGKQPPSRPPFADRYTEVNDFMGGGSAWLYSSDAWLDTAGNRVLRDEEYGLIVLLVRKTKPLPDFSCFSANGRTTELVPYDLNDPRSITIQRPPDRTLYVVDGDDFKIVASMPLVGGDVTKMVERHNKMQNGSETFPETIKVVTGRDITAMNP